MMTFNIDYDMIYEMTVMDDKFYGFSFTGLLGFILCFRRLSEKILHLKLVRMT